jgi:hypothetical protein
LTTTDENGSSTTLVTTISITKTLTITNVSLHPNVWSV